MQPYKLIQSAKVAANTVSLIYVKVCTAKNIFTFTRDTKIVYHATNYHDSEMDRELPSIHEQAVPLSVNISYCCLPVPLLKTLKMHTKC